MPALSKQKTNVIKYPSILNRFRKLAKKAERLPSQRKELLCYVIERFLDNRVTWQFSMSKDIEPRFQGLLIFKWGD